jgi:hypothetical protein
MSLVSLAELAAELNTSAGELEMSKTNPGLHISYTVMTGECVHLNDVNRFRAALKKAVR